MGAQEVDVVRRLIDAYNRQDVPALVALCDSDVEFVSLMQGVEPRIYRGYEGTVRYAETLTETFENLRLEPEELRDEGDCVVALGRIRGRGRTSGIDTDRELAAVYRLREGKIVWSGVFSTREEALAAVAADDCGAPGWDPAS